MPLRTAQILVRTRSLDDLGEALGRALQKGGRPAGERTLVAFCLLGWGTVVEERLDEQLARALSERFGTAIALGLDGGALSLSMRTWTAGEPGEEERDPVPPHFRDVEAVAWELLEYLDVPPAMRVLPLADIEIRQDRVGLEAVLARAGPQQIEMWTVSVVPPARSEELPVEPDLVVESAAGESRALEVRDLPPGIPGEAWAEALVEIEEAQARRLLRALADREEQRVPRPTFAYRTEQAPRMEKLLSQARRARPWLARLLDAEREPPLTHAGFTALCRERIAAELPEAVVARAHGGHLELLAGATCLRTPVYTVYKKNYFFSLDEEEAGGEVVARVRELLARPAEPVAEWPEAAGKFLPTLLAGDRGTRAAREIAPALHAALLCDDGERIAPVLGSDLAALGLTMDAALAKAIAHADELTERSPQAVRWFDLDFGRVVSCEFSDAAGAGRLLSAGARALILQILDEERAYAAAPTRDALLACAADDEEGAAWLRDEARRRFEEGPFSIHAGLWVITASSVTPL